MRTLLEDVFIVENLRVINEGKTSGPMVIEGTFQRADEENNNKRIYSKALLEREMKKLVPAISERRLMGELDHPQHDSVKLNNVSHLITGLRMEGKEVVGRAEILNTPAGKVAQALIEGGVKVGISSRGLGTLSEDENGKRHVNEDFQLVTWDLVADPSTRGAYPGLTESTVIQDIIDTTLPDAQKLKNFGTLLRSKLDEQRIKEARKDEDFKDVARAGGKLAKKVAKRVGKISTGIGREASRSAKKAKLGKKLTKAAGAVTKAAGAVAKTAGGAVRGAYQGAFKDHTELARYLRAKLDEIKSPTRHGSAIHKQTKKRGGSDFDANIDSETASLRRADRIAAARKERGSRRAKHFDRTGTEARRDARLSQAGKAQSGNRAKLEP